MFGGKSFAQKTLESKGRAYDGDTRALERENAALRALVREVVDGDWTDAAYAAELPSRLAESGWFARARRLTGVCP